ncbi:MAG TPA: PQQ-binding-like beta-propeller repeat protein [Streptosporangiaceae bacterium]|nr:PQQ-binding-like beta-propeller repeat protein [Streptosporangiaceae bacterium]
MPNSLRSEPALVTGAAVLALAAAIVGACPAGAAARSAAWRRPAPAAARQALASGSTRTLDSGPADWPMFQGGPAHLGVSAETAISVTTAPHLASGWTASLGATGSYASPAVATSTSLGEALVYAGSASHFYAYPATGGAPVWEYSLGSTGGNIQASPAVFGGVVYIASSAGIVYALNASTGALMCDFTIGHHIQAAPVVVDAPDGSGPVLYVGTDPGKGVVGAEYAVYGAGNTHGSCALDWQFTSWQAARGGTWSPPAYGTDADGNPVLVFGSRDPDDSVYALNAVTGALDWRYQTSTQRLMDVGAAPTISAPGTNGFADGVAYVSGKDHIAYALDLTTGRLVWHHYLEKNGQDMESSSALEGGTLYLASNDGVYALNARTGKQVWHTLTGVTFYASAAVTGPAGQQVLVVANDRGRVYALSLADGATVWTTRPTAKAILASPAISQGSIYVVGLDGMLRSFAPASS